LRPTFVDLFAGAGGLSLGLHAAGFEPVLAVEHSTMAAETYYMNFVERDSNAWKRHRELGVDDQIRAGLAVQETRTVLDHVDLIAEVLAGRPLNLLAGGPPCQGFSLAGMRDPDDERNKLPFEFLEFVDHLRPSVVLIENVVGIGLRFNDGTRAGPLDELRQALANKGYLAQILEVNARDFGVAQHRPRIMIVGMRFDTAGWLLPKLCLEEVLGIVPARWSSSGRGAESERVYDRDVSNGILAPRRLLAKNCHPTVADALDDLCEDARSPSNFVAWLNATLEPPAGPDPDGLSNHELRSHSEKTTARFMLHLALAARGVPGSVFGYMAKAKAQADELRSKSEKVPSTLEKGAVRLRIINELQRAQVPTPLRFGDRPIKVEGLGTATDDDIGYDHESIADALIALTTLKHSQRALSADGPSPAVLSLPDDFVHYRHARTLSVREMARLQSFPDTFRFYSKVTTGGESRAREVPQYTQVGNAVPPLMAYRVGLHLRRLLVRAAVRADRRRRSTRAGTAV
jgi:DNA (cytosine-5)-methyltransferase 1